MPETMLLIPGRSSKQGTSLNKGKLGDEYRDVTSTVEINADDMVRLGFNDGDKLRLKNHVGEAVVTCVSKKATDLPEGMIFIAYGPTSSRLMEGDTAGSGMPLSKHLPVEVEKIS
ncbi:MAG: formylmethanofuran dehydrogenase [Gammaproteobacteria bacterium]|nr:formylmethanofuran dehydrogenase [Gammaproteobacteria bacterium]MDE0157022.1 formylmethanofuran dehydrogenase [Gammaproteobacteria bacterium]MDE0283763.1 formylmethanofuran dehydrogenase [Gammaproteobacteria bacterium]MDE0512876.1 formylmethanofuran dehydrogenase [Gammaproteobacteria bacterium]MYH69264.1 formylmethanofuran dehydrogenase [Gammaproteobacteria bacterium]